MGGEFAEYVWPAYGVFFAVVGALIWRAVSRARAVREELQRVEREEA